MNARRRRDLFRPLVEALEPRRLLACEVLFREGTLTILGDKSDNVIDLLAARDGIHVTCDGKSSGPFAGVQAVLVQAGAGNDAFRFSAEESLGAGAIGDTDGDGLPEIVDVDGGPGRDAFHILASPTKRLTLDGGQHADTYDIQFGRLLGAVRVNDSGQAGQDRLRLLGTQFDEKIELNGGGQDAWIAKWEGPDLNGGGNEVAIESIEIAHEGIELAEVETGDGDNQVTVDDRDGLLAPVPLAIHSGAGSLQATLFIAKQQALRDRRPSGLRLFDGGAGDSRLTVIGADDVGQMFNAQPGKDAGFVEIDVTDMATRTQLAQVSAVDLDRVTIKGGGDDDEFNVDVNNDGLVTPIDLIGGGGNDELTVRASQLAEVIEIIGALREVPDPLIRGTSVATGAALFEVSAFETEAITVDSRGGDDVVTMREEDASLASVDWTILTGGGNDVVDARLAAIPGLLRVLTGLGDDDVSLAFADNPNLPVPPPDPDAPPPEIAVDVGAGVDSVVLDVFGSLATPPSDLGEVGAQVTLEEVLASIQVSGVGLLALLTLFPLGALEMKQSIQDDRAGHIKTEASITLDGLNLAAELSTGGSSDSILIGLSPQPGGKIDLNLDTGRGDDRIEVRSVSGAGDVDLSLAIDPETPSGFLPEVGDEVIVAFQHGDVDRPIIIGSVWNSRTQPGQPAQGGGGALALTAKGQGDDFAVDFNLQGGRGRDAVQFQAQYPPDPIKVVSDIDIATGQGDDAIDVQVQSAAESLQQKVRIDSGAGDDRVTVNVPAARTDGLADIIVGAGPGAGPQVKAFDAASLAEAQSFFAYDPGFAGGVRVATGDVNGDGVADIITGAGPGAAGGHVKVFDGRSGAELSSFFAYPGFAGGVFVAAGDVNGDGRADIVTGADEGDSGGHVKVFDGETGAEVQSFFAYPGFAGGVRVAAGDVNGDGVADIITGAGPGVAGGHVKVFDGRTGGELQSFFAYPGFAGGVFVAAGDVNCDGRPDVITGADAGASDGHVKVFDGLTGVEVQSFFAFPGFAGGVRVAAGDVNGDGFADIITGAGPGAGPHVKVFDGRTNAELHSFFAFDPSASGGVFVAAGDLNSAVQPKRLDLDLAIETGGGDDVVKVDSDANADELQQKVHIEGGGGEDGITVVLRRLANPHLPPQSTMLAASDLTLIDLDGGGGNDRLSLDFRGTILGRQAVDAVLRGGVGDDQVRARFDLDPASTGQLSAQVLGEGGDDELGLAVLNADNLDLLFALLDGGKGKDRCRATANVIVTNCP